MKSSKTAVSFDIRYDLGLSKLIPAWKRMLKPAGLRADLMAGLTVGTVALPLSLAVALGSGVEPVVGLITAIVAGIVGSLFGGTTLAVGGPTATMAIVVAAVVERDGLGGLFVVGMTMALLQFLVGFFGFGRLARLVPVSVVHGFTAGVGAIIFVGELPRALGLVPPDQAHVIEVVKHVASLISEVHPAALMISALAFACTMFLPMVSPKIPGALVGLLVASGVAVFFRVEQLHQAPPLSFAPTWPSFDFLETMTLIGDGFVLFAIGSLESLLSSSAVDRISKGERHDPDQEILGQGLVNAAVTLLGGIPATSVIARSSLNAQAGAETRRASFFHAIFLILLVVFARSYLVFIPVPALAGVLLAVALRMINLKEFLALARTARTEALVFGITFFSIVGFDLLVGVQAGLAVAVLMAAVRFGRSDARLHTTAQSNVVSFSGPITFLSAVKMDSLADRLALETNRGAVVFDLSDVPAVDQSGAEMLSDVVTRLETLGRKVFFLSPAVSVRSKLIEVREDLEGRFAVSYADLEKMGARMDTAHDRLLMGAQRYQQAVEQRYAPLFDELAQGQSPHTLFFTCADSRISPSLITATAPGELFIVRCLGNIVPPYPFEENAVFTNAAAIDYAVDVLKVKQVVVCGHSMCGAMKALREPDLVGAAPALAHWHRFSKPQFVEHNHDATDDEVSKANVVQQIERLREYPAVLEAVRSRGLSLHGWFYSVNDGKIHEFDGRDFRPLGSTGRASIRSPHVSLDEVKS